MLLVYLVQTSVSYDQVETWDAVGISCTDHSQLRSGRDLRCRPVYLVKTSVSYDQVETWDAVGISCTDHSQLRSGRDLRCRGYILYRPQSVPIRYRLEMPWVYLVQTTVSYDQVETWDAVCISCKDHGQLRSGRDLRCRVCISCTDHSQLRSGRDLRCCVCISCTDHSQLRSGRDLRCPGYILYRPQSVTIR